MQQLFGAISEVLAGLKMDGQVDQALVFAAWKQCAGKLLSERTVPVEFVDHRLIITVADETWRRHLEDLIPQMLVKINGSLGQGTVKRIEFKLWT